MGFVLPWSVPGEEEGESVDGQDSQDEQEAQSQEEVAADRENDESLEKGAAESADEESLEEVASTVNISEITSLEIYKTGEPSGDKAPISWSI